MQMAHCALLTRQQELLQLSTRLLAQKQNSMYYLPCTARAGTPIFSMRRANSTVSLGVFRRRILHVTVVSKFLRNVVKIYITMHSLSKRGGYLGVRKKQKETIKTSTSCISSGLESNAAPIPPLSEKDFGQPMLISIAATSWHLGRMKYYSYQLKKYAKHKKLTYI